MDVALPSGGLESIEHAFLRQLNVGRVQILDKVNAKLARGRFDFHARLGCSNGGGFFFCRLGHELRRKSDAEFSCQGFVQQQPFPGNIFNRDAFGGFAQQHAHDGASGRKPAFIITHANARHRSARGEIRIVIEQREPGVSGGLHDDIEGLRHCVVALNIERLHAAAYQGLRGLQHIARTGDGGFLELDARVREIPAGDLDHFAGVGFRSIVDGADALDSRHGRADQIHHLLHRRKRADARQVGQVVREALPCARGEGIGTIGEHHRLALDQTARSADDRRGHGHDQVHIRAVKILEHRRYVWNLRLGVGTPHLEIFAFLESHRAHPVENSIQANLPARLGREIGKANFEMPAWRDTKCSRCGSDT